MMFTFCQIFFPLQAKMKYSCQKNKIKEVPFIPFNGISYFVAERSFFLIDLQFSKCWNGFMKSSGLHAIDVFVL